MRIEFSPVGSTMIGATPLGFPLTRLIMARIDPEPVEIADGGVRKHVITDGGDHHDRGAELGCGHSLIGSLAAVSHLEAWRLDSLTLDRHPIDVGDKVHHVAANDGDARLVRLGHFPGLSMFAAAAMALYPVVSAPRRRSGNQLR